MNRIINQLDVSNQHKPAPVNVPIGYVLAHEEYKKTLEKIAYMTALYPQMDEEEMKKAMLQISELAKSAIVEAELYNMKY